ncbi:unnamed protein product [Allacma fusca]|uniref:Uncharacterized protein n=1 Tax=Allacma fusca TaxID=39272 RepID=A0A8J2LSS4_9HEXA|nr:unnamed protein product [Allacma fusca]
MMFLKSKNNFLLKILATLVIITVTSELAKCQTDISRHISRHNKKNPNCKVSTQRTLAPNAFTVISPNVFRIVGEYGKIIFNCTAPYLLDFDFDGTRPSEAIHLFFWKGVKPSVSMNNSISSNVQRYGMEVNILSIQNLFDEFKTFRKSNVEKHRVKQLVHKDLTVPISYSRTGKYVIRHMFSGDIDQKLEFYFFLEEPDSERTFIENSYTLSTYIYEASSGTHTLTIPCRPSHYTENATVVISNNRGSLSNIKFNPTAGFTISGITNEFISGTTFYCEAVFNPISSRGLTTLTKSYEYSGQNLTDSNSVNTYGEESIRNQIFDSRVVQVNNVEITVTRDEFFANLKCSFSIPPAKRGDFRFQAVGLQHPSGFRFGQEFTLPAYSNRSYFVRAAVEDDEAVEYLIEYLPPSGTFYCTNGPTYSYIQFFSGLGSRGYEFATGTNWPGLVHHGAPPDTHGRLDMLSPNPGTTLYSYMNFEFLCRGTPFVMSRPILWFTKNINGTVKLHWVDTQSYEARSILRIKFTVDIAQIFCRVSWYQSDNWRERAITLEFADALRSPPKIITAQEPLQFYLNTKNQKISCEASGTPTPSVWWEDKNRNVLTNKTKGSSIYTFSTVTSRSSGDYFCIAENEYGERTERIFTVSTEAYSTNTGVIVGIVVTIVVVFAVIIGIIYYYWWERTTKIVLSLQEVKDFEEGFDPKQRGDDETSSTPLAQPYNREFEIPKAQYQIDSKSVLGSGAYGIVKKGIVNGVPAAVKTIRTGADKSYLKSLLSELKILIYLGKHPNLIELIGANTVQLKKGIAFVFVEYCDHGSLLSYLQTNREKFLRSQEMPGSEPGYDVEILNNWAIHIAQGMTFLKTNKVIHGDLAARNVLLTKNMVAKITDFGLSRQLYNYSMYMKQNQEPLPWRWMALESLSDLSFSCESDIWSYGVTLWEIYSLGQVPFPGMSWDIDFVNYLRNGNRMGCPKMASNELFSNVISRCWMNEPTKRPTFVELCQILNPQLNLEDPVSSTKTEAVKNLKEESRDVKKPDQNNTYENSTVLMQSKTSNVQYLKS